MDTDILRAPGAVLMALGLAINFYAMARCTIGPLKSLVWMRGVLQRREDFTVRGWRLYWLGVAILAVGSILFAIGIGFDG
jgi:hypothetical protein